MADSWGKLLKNYSLPKLPSATRQAINRVNLPKAGKTKSVETKPNKVTTVKGTFSQRQVVTKKAVHPERAVKRPGDL